MNIEEQRERAEALRRMHHAQRPLLLPNAWDAMSARAFAMAGFGAIATTSAGMAWALGYPDGEQAPLEEVIAAIARITRVVDVPVTADIEGGFAADAAGVEATIGKVIAAGAVGVNLEDSIPGHHDTTRPLAEAVERIRAARRAADAAGIPLVINARVDTYLAPAADEAARFNDTVNRCKAYLQAGADCVYPLGLSDRATIEALVRTLQAPVNVMGHPGMPALEELQRMGVRRVSTASGLTLVALEASLNAARQLLASGSFGSAGSRTGYMDAQRLFPARR